MENYSVLLSIYQRGNPEHFRLAIESMMKQTVPTNDFVIVCDGPLTSELEGVLAAFLQEYPRIFQIIRLEENVGIGAAANIGLQYCKNDLVAKMDADDISAPDRCERQLKLFSENPQLAVCGGYIAEFDQNPDNPFCIREVPVTNTDIRSYARRRQPFNNMTVMYRKTAVQEVGGYRNFRRSEDYDLYLRLLHNGHYALNIGAVLVCARVDNSAYSRRASLATMKGCAQSRWYAYRIGYSSLLDFLICVAGEFVILVSPTKLQQFIYQQFLRKKIDNDSE